MVKITLNNRDEHSPYKQVVIDLASDRCRFNNGEEINRLLFIKAPGFVHPLLTQTILSKTDGFYHYIYDDFDALLQAITVVYATLIQADNPRECRFKITPSPQYVQLKADYKIPFSIHRKKQATARISIKQLNGFISQTSGFSFHYLDSILLDRTLTIKNLPETMDGELLYQTDLELTRFLKQPDCMDNYELRYINQRIGLGVFARNPLKEGDIITQYCGTLVTNKILNKAYCYKTKNNGFSLNVDARKYGNLSRFINHAPKKNPINQTRSQTDILTSNIAQSNCNLFGNSIIIYSAKRNIEKGEQLLTDYGSVYFEKPNTLLRIKQNGDVINETYQRINDSSSQRAHTLNIMKQNDIKQAQWLFIRRPAIIFLIALLLVLFLNYS